MLRKISVKRVDFRYEVATLNFPSTKEPSYPSVYDGEIHVDRLDRDSLKA